MVKHVVQKLKKMLCKQFAWMFMVSLCLIGIVSSYKYSSASLSYYSARNLLESWVIEGEVARSSTVHEALDHIADARAAHPSHPLYHYLSAQIIEWGVFSNALPHEQLIEAQQHYTRALELNPTWSVTYASLALIEWRKGQLNDSFWDYLKMADNLGPMQPEVHILISKVGLTLYANNNMQFLKIRESVKKRIFLGLMNENSRAELLTFIKESETKETVCRWMRNTNTYVTKNLLKCRFS